MSLTQMPHAGGFVESYSGAVKKKCISSSLQISSYVIVTFLQFVAQPILLHQTPPNTRKAIQITIRIFNRVKCKVKVYFQELQTLPGQNICPLVFSIHDQHKKTQLPKTKVNMNDCNIMIMQTNSRVVITVQQCFEAFQVSMDILIEMISPSLLVVSEIITLTVLLNKLMHASGQPVTSTLQC